MFIISLITICFIKRKYVKIHNSNTISHETRSISTSINPDESEILLSSSNHSDQLIQDNIDKYISQQQIDNEIISSSNNYYDNMIIVNQKKDLSTTSSSPESIILTNKINNEVISMNNNSSSRIPSPESFDLKSDTSPIFPSSSPISISVGGETIPLSFNQYSSNFTELQCIGSGGFSKVFLTKRIIDESLYAVKKIPITSKINTATTISEVRLMAKLHHQNIVRYYQAWYEAVEKGTFTLDNGEEEEEEEQKDQDDEDDFFLVDEESNEKNKFTNELPSKNKNKSKKGRENVKYQSTVYKVNSNKKGKHLTFDDDE